ncbi:dihydroorotate dehydrogenase [Bacillus sp. SCS-153A]|uniref:dihydroorotate dehydrogenase n=1 Tax=Rossellomorea sedimentorum TaxID=3115294 RepID=UPI003905944A
MPDWSYHVVFKPILTKLSPVTSREFIHKGMNRIASLPFGHHIINFLGREESSPFLSRQLDGITFSNPVGLSGKIDPFLSGTKAFTNLGFGFIEVGPVSLMGLKCPTDPLVDYENSHIQFPEGGSHELQFVLERLRNIKKKQPIFIRLTGTASELQTMVGQLEGIADGFIVDKPCGLRSKKPIYLSISDTSHLPLDELQHFSGIVLDLGEHYTTDKMLTVKQLRKSGFSKTILTSGSVIEPQDAIDLLAAGADLVMLSGGYVFAGPGLTKRIKEALVSREEPPLPQNGWFSYWLFGLFIFLGGVLALVFSLTSIVLPYDEMFLGMKKEDIWTYNKRIMLFMAHDRMTLAGTMISGGIVYMTLAKYGVRHGLKWAKQATDTAAIVGFLGIFSFIGFGYFDWLHLLFWLVLLPFYIAGFIKTKEIRGTPSSANRRNHRVWKVSLFGQFLFVLLGFSFVLGGIIISLYGVTSVFVPTDLLYLCMTPEMLESFNERLIPVIAHDRAGFGSALLSVGLLVLLMALWGFHQGNKWMWWTFLLGGLPAFIAGIYVHFAIGYTSFIHLLPAYFAILLYIGGLFTTYKYFHKGTDR